MSRGTGAGRAWTLSRQPWPRKLLRGLQAKGPAPCPAPSTGATLGAGRGASFLPSGMVALVSREGI